MEARPPTLRGWLRASLARDLPAVHGRFDDANTPVRSRAPGHGVLCGEHSWNRWTDFAPLTAAVAPTTASFRARRLIGGDRSPEFGREHSLSVEAFDSADESCSVLVDNTGGALGLGRVADSSDEQWSEMYERNVLSILRMTRALLPKLIASGNGRIVNIGSVAGFHVYEGAAVTRRPSMPRAPSHARSAENSGGSRSGSPNSP